MLDPTKPIPPAAGVVAVVGKQPLPFWMDPDHTGVPLWNRKVVRDSIVSAVLWGLSKVAPKSPYVILLQGYQTQIEALIDKGAA